MIRVLISVLLTGYLLPGILYAQDSPENTKPIVGPATTTTITDARRERIAKIIGYSAGRLQTDERDSDNSREGATGFLDFLGSAGLDHVTARGDREFHDQLEAESLKLLDEIDLENGLQALLLKDKFTERALIVFRGTEASKGSWTELFKDASSDLQGYLQGQLRVGKNQYDAAKEKLGTWTTQHSGNVEVIGHSLGAALGQRLMIDRGSDILFGTFFNAPGLERDVIDQMVEDDTYRNLLSPDGTRKVRIYNAKSDPVGYAGMAHILADTFLCSGGDVDSGLIAAHTAMIFGQGVRRIPTGYYDMAATRGFQGVEARTSLVASISGLINRHVLGEPSLMELLRDLQDTERDWLRQNDLTTPDIRLGHARAAMYTLDLLRKRVEDAAMAELRAGDAAMQADAGVAGEPEADLALAEVRSVWNMMAGIHPGNPSRDDGDSWPLDRLLREIHNEHLLRGAVEYMADRAGSRGYGQLSGESERELANRLFQQAWPVVHDAWQEERAKGMRNIDRAMAALTAHPLRIRQRPDPAHASVKPGTAGAATPEWDEFDLTAIIDDSDGRLKQTLELLRAEMARFGETQKAAVSANIEWQGGQAADEEFSRIYTVDEPGTYPAKAELILSTTPIAYREDADFARSVRIPLSMNLLVLPPDDPGGDTRTAKLSIHEPRKMDGKCADFFDLEFEFTFPVEGGAITSLVFDASSGWNMCDTDSDTVCVLGCQLNEETAELISGEFEGGDGGKFRIEYWDIDQRTGDRERNTMNGTIWSNGNVTVDAATSQTHKMFEPF